MNSPLVRSSTIGYSVLLAISLAVAFWQGRLVDIFGFPGWPRLALHVLLGVLLAALVLMASRMLRTHFLWARQLEEEFRLYLSPIGTSDAVILAISSGFVEELFFRAILQPTLGLWLTSIAFGLLHYPMNRRMIPWALLATLLGLLFGYVYLRTGSLVAVAVAHGLINFFELMSIVRSGPGEMGDAGLDL